MARDDTKMNTESLKLFADLAREVDSVLGAIVEKEATIKNTLADQVGYLKDAVRILEDHGRLTQEQANHLNKVLDAMTAMVPQAKTVREEILQTNKQIREWHRGFTDINSLTSKLSPQLTGVFKSFEDIGAGFLKGPGAGMIASFGAVLELAVSVNREMVQLHKLALGAAGALGKLAIPGAGMGGITEETKKTIETMTFTYGSEVTRQVIGAGARIGVGPEERLGAGSSGTRGVEYIWAASKILGMSLEQTATMIADISVKVEGAGGKLGVSALVFAQLGDDFSEVGANLRMSFDQYVQQVMSLYESNRLYGMSIGEASAITKKFAEEIRTGTLSFETMSKVFTLGGRAPEQALPGMGWLGAMGMTIPGQVDGAAVSRMSPVAQMMAVFTDPKIQQNLIKQLMTGGQKFGEMMGFGGAEGGLIGQYFQRMMVQQVFGIQLGAKEWETFQKTVMPEVAKGVPIEKAMEQVGIKGPEDVMAAYAKDWGVWASKSLTWEERISSLLQIVSLSLGGISNFVTGIFNLMPRVGATAIAREVAGESFSVIAGEIINKAIQTKGEMGQIPMSAWTELSGGLEAAYKPFMMTMDEGIMRNFRMMLATFAPHGALEEDIYGSFQYGGVAPETAKYQLHKGEEVIATTSARRGDSVSVNINVGRMDEYVIETIGNLAKDRVMDELRKQRLYEPAFGV